MASGPDLPEGRRRKSTSVERPFRGRCGERRQQALDQPCVILGAGKRPFAVGNTGPFVEVVEEDQVEIGRRGHLASAELAHGQHRDLAARVSCRASARTRDGLHRGAPRRPLRPASRRPRRRRARRWCRRGRGRRSERPAPARRCGRGRGRPRSRRPGRRERAIRSARIVRSGAWPKNAGSISASSTRDRCATISANRGAVAIIVARRPSRPGLELRSEKSCTPAGSRARNRSNAANAPSAFLVVESHSMSAGTNSVSRSRAVAERIAG